MCLLPLANCAGSGGGVGGSGDAWLSDVKIALVWYAHTHTPSLSLFPCLSISCGLLLTHFFFSLFDPSDMAGRAVQVPAVSLRHPKHRAANATRRLQGRHCTPSGLFQSPTHARICHCCCHCNAGDSAAPSLRHRHRHRQTQSQTHTHTHTITDTDIHTITDTHTHNHRHTQTQTERHTHTITITPSNCFIPQKHQNATRPRQTQRASQAFGIPVHNPLYQGCVCSSHPPSNVILTCFRLHRDQPARSCRVC